MQIGQETVMVEKAHRVDVFMLEKLSVMVQQEAKLHRTLNS